MEMFSRCAGKCKDCVTHFTGGCMAGHGDDDFELITEEWAIKILQNPFCDCNKNTPNPLLERYPHLKHLKY